ncbi:competence domain protein [Streptococcus pneumoniae 2070335]|nr:competence domain protein [Streptococcus pneumoniae 2070335]
MFVARDARGELVNVLEDKLEKQAYTCPACGGQIHLRQGPSVRTHFAHKSLKDCDFSLKMKVQNTWPIRNPSITG